MKNKCKCCGVTEKDAPFYNGVSNFCKECHKARVRQNRAENVERYRKYDAYRFRNDPKVLARRIAYNATPAGRASGSAAKRKWLAANADKRAAHTILGNAVRYGKIEKPLTCSVCGSGGRINAHHDDYTMPLRVVWCCSKCHYAIHNPKEPAQCA